MKFREYLHKRKKVYSGRFIDFSVDTIKLPDGTKSIREYAQHPGAVAVLPFLNKNKIILVKQYRYPVKSITYELPAGKLEKGENLITCVRRELIEETGFRATEIRKLISYWPTPAFSTEVIHIYVATKLTPVRSPSGPDRDEFIDKIIISFNDAIKFIDKGMIRDSKTIIALLLYKRKGKYE